MQHRPSDCRNAVELLRAAWLARSDRTFEHIEIIDVVQQSFLHDRWSAFAPTNHYWVARAFERSRLTRCPRRSRESLLYPITQGMPCEGFPLPTTDSLAALQEFAAQIAQHGSRLACGRAAIGRSGGSHARMAQGPAARGSAAADRKWESRLEVKVATYFLQRMKTKWGGCNHEAKTHPAKHRTRKEAPRTCSSTWWCTRWPPDRSNAQRAVRGVLGRHYPAWRETRAELNELPLAVEVWKSNRWRTAKGPAPQVARDFIRLLSRSRATPS